MQWNGVWTGQIKREMGGRYDIKTWPGSPNTG